MSRIKVIDAYFSAHPKDNPISFPIFGSGYTEEYMQGYGADFTKIDGYFAKKYKTFELENDFDLSITGAFASAMKNFIAVNDNKLRELYRMEVIDDELYSLYNNYDMTETAHSEATIDTGSRTDTQSVNPYDGTAFTESGQNEMGAQHNTSGGDSTLHRVGNIGVMTVSDMLTRHDELFSKYVSFYDKLFSMFADEYLYIGGY